MTPEFKKAIGFTLWGIAAIVFVAEQFLHRRLRSYVKERYPDKATWRGWRRFGTLKQEMKTDQVLRTMYRQVMGTKWLEGLLVVSAAALSDWHFGF